MEKYLDSRDLEEELVNCNDPYRAEEIENLKEQVNSKEWEKGITFIEQDEFEEYAISQIHELGHMKEDHKMFEYIDFDKWIHNFSKNYQEIDFNKLIYVYKV